MKPSVESGAAKVIAAAWKRTGSLTSALGLVIVIGFIVTVTAGWVFTELAETIQAGATVALDDSVLRWMGAHQSSLGTTVALEITALGTGTTVVMFAALAGLFLALTKQRDAAILLVVSTMGGLVLNILLKLHYHRPRPHIFAWDTNAASTSFPSGHAMNAVIVYGTVAYLASRLSERRSIRVVTLLVATALVIAIATSRVYLGVHYPSDVLGGAIVGLAWMTFCMSALEGLQRLRARAARARGSDHTKPGAR